MALSGKLEADFQNFDSACTATEAKLASLGASGLKTGVEVDKLGTKATATVLPFNTLGQSLRQFDGVLAAAGLHVGPEIRALEELGEAAEKSTKDIGLLGTGAAAFGAFAASYKLTNMVLEFTGLGKVLADGDNYLYDWGIAAETAGAKQDVLDRATKNAKRTITDYTEAIQINQQAQDDWKGPIEAAAKLATFEASLKQTAFEAEHLTLAQQGVIAEALKMGRSITAIAEATGLTTDGIELYLDALKATEKAEAAAAAEAEKLARQIPPVAEATAAVAVATQDAVAATEVWNTGLVIQTGVVETLGNELDAMIAKLDASNESFIKLGHKTVNADGTIGSDLGKGYARSLSEFDPAVVAMYRKMGFEDWQIMNLLLNLANPWDYQATIDKKKTGGKAGGATASGGSPSGGGVLTAGGLGGPGTGRVSVPVTVNVNGLLDPATKATLAKLVSDEVVRAVLQATRI